MLSSTSSSGGAVHKFSIFCVGVALFNAIDADGDGAIHSRRCPLHWDSPASLIKKFSHPICPC